MVDDLGVLALAQSRLKGSFTIGVDLRPLGYAFNLAGGTKLSALNGRAGVVAPAGAGKADLRLYFADNTSVDVSFESLLQSGQEWGELTVAQVMEAMVDASDEKLQMGLSLSGINRLPSDVDPAVVAMADGGSRLWLRDMTFDPLAPGKTFRIEALKRFAAGLAVAWPRSHRHRRRWSRRQGRWRHLRQPSPR